MEVPAGVTPEAYEQARALMRRLYALTSPDERADPAFKAKATLALAKLVDARVRPGDHAGSVTSGSWQLKRWRSKEQVRISATSTVRAAVEDATTGSTPMAVKGGSVLWVPVDQVARAARACDRIALDLAQSLRLAFLAGEEVRTDDRSDLEHLSGAGDLDDVDPELADRCRAWLRTVPIPLELTLRPFQRVGVAYAWLSDFRCLIADSMGLGKTVQAIACLTSNPDKLLPAVVIAPTSVTYNWQDELAKWAPGYPVVNVDSSKALLGGGPDAIYIVPWSLLEALIEPLLFLGLQTAVIDESQMMKHATAKRTKAAMTLCRAVPHRLLLSGTPMENRPVEMWTQLHVIDPEAFPERKQFLEEYTGGNRRRTFEIERGGRTIRRSFADVGDAGLADLTDRLRSYMVRRLKTDVLKDLPDKTRRPVWVPLPRAAMAAYRKVEKEMHTWLLATFRKRSVVVAAKRYLALWRDGMDPRAAAEQAVAEVNAAPPSAQLARMAIVRLGVLRRLVGQAKVPAAIERIVDHRDASGGAPIVVFVEHQPVLHMLGEALDGLKLRWTYIDGSVSAKQRGERQRDFQAGEYDVIVGSIAMHAGINLFRACDVLFVERWWVPAKEEQAEDRCHRMGQRNPVQVTQLMAPGTVDEHIAALVDHKRALIEQVLGAERVTSETETTDLEDMEESEVSTSLAVQLVTRITQEMQTSKRESYRVSVRFLRSYLRSQRA